MMEISKLDTASQYINNALLSRGLLRNGRPLDFARVQNASTRNQGAIESAPCIASATHSAQVINLVHDLILKRDRDQENYEALASSLKTLRHERSRDRAEIDRLTELNNTLRREAVVNDASVRAANAVAQTAEASHRALRDEAARARAAIAQVKSQCAGDLRRRDLELAKLKAHFANRQRGSKQSRPASMIIRPGAINPAPNLTPQRDMDANLSDPEFVLRQESTEFLTQLSRSLSEENDALITLARSTLDSLRDLLVISPSSLLQSESYSTCGATDTQKHCQALDKSLVQDLQTSQESLAQDLELVLQGLRDLLTNPSFAPIEEVQSREDEIYRLREGWENMEARWNEAMLLMQKWKRRMMSGGDNININELRDGLKLGEGLSSPYSSHTSAIEKLQQTPAEVPIRPLSLIGTKDTVKPTDEMAIGESGSEPPSRSLGSKTDSESACRRFRRLSPMDEVSPSHIFNPSPAASRPSSGIVSQLKHLDLEVPNEQNGAFQVFEDYSEPDEEALDKGTWLSVDEKLALAAREAQGMSSDAKVQRHPSKAARDSPESSKENPRGPDVKSCGKSARRSGISGSTRRRKSTLSPHELEALIAT